MRLNVEHDFSLTSTIFGVSVAKHFFNQLLIREFYTHVALICKWQGINTYDVFEEYFQELADTYVSLKGGIRIDRAVAWSECSCQCVNCFFVPWGSLLVTSKFWGSL